MDWHEFLENYTVKKENCYKRYKLWYKMLWVFVFYALSPIIYCTFGDTSNPD